MRLGSSDGVLHPIGASTDRFVSPGTPIHGSLDPAITVMGTGAAFTGVAAGSEVAAFTGVAPGLEAAVLLGAAVGGADADD